MMLRQENDELQMLKVQVQEMAQEIAHLKSEIKLAKDNQNYISQDLGKGFGKTIGRALFKANSAEEVFNNKNMFNQLVKAVSFAIHSKVNISSFGEEL